MAEQSCNGGFGEKRKAHEPVSPHDSKRGTYYFPSGSNGFVTAPFTPGQWVELHRQALIYKHIVASVPVPPYLLFPIHYSNASCYIVDGGGKVVNLGFLLDNPDPEPRRCRRTDGKKWRCSKDSAPDQKYCERHLHRGKPRSRKPVEPPKNNSLQNDSNTKKNPRVTQHYNNLLYLNYNDLEDYRYPILNSGLSSVEEETMETRGFIDAWSTEKRAMMTPGGNLASDHELLHDPGLSLSMSHDQIDFGLTDPPFTRANWANQGSSLDGPLGEFFQPHQQLTESATEDPHCPELIDLWNKDYNENLNHTHEISPRESPTRQVISSPSGVLHKTLFSQSDSSNVSSPSFGVFNWHLS